MKKITLQFILCFFSLAAIEVEYPDLGGIIDFSKPEEISDSLFLLTNPKSGSHLLMYSIMALTKRPTRGRLPICFFYNDPPCFKTINLMNYELDFSKPTTYFGHEYHLLKPLNRNKNKLIFTLRNFKENILSDVLIKYGLGKIEDNQKTVEKMFKKEILYNRMILKEYIIRLELFDNWNEKYRMLVPFDELVHKPEEFVPKMLAFLEEDVDCSEFINNYLQFKTDLRVAYDKTQGSTGSGSKSKHFANYISAKTLKIVDRCVKRRYPVLWEKYLKQFAEEGI